MIRPEHAATVNPIWPWQRIFGKKWTIVCGWCGYVWRGRLPVAERMSAECPRCKKINAWEAEVVRGS